MNENDDQESNDEDRNVSDLRGRTDPATKDTRKRIKRAIIWFLLIVFALSLSILGVLMTSRLSFFSISGSSMEPSLHNGDSVILKQETNVRHNQIIFFSKPRTWNDYKIGSNITLVKRIVAIPGDTVSYDGTAFYVQGEKIYDVRANGYECKNGQKGYSHTLTKQEIMVFGDNAKESLDSRRIFCDGGTKDIYIPKHSVLDYGHIVKIF